MFDQRAMFHLRMVSLFGLCALLGLCYLFSQDRKGISWRLVGSGLLIQVLLGTVFLYWEWGNAWLQGLGQGVENFLRLSQEGTVFVFGALGDPKALETALPGNTFVFATQVLPTLIFFSALMAVLYHLGVMQAIVRGMARAVVKLLGTSGAESLSACGNIFVGQTEAPLMVKPFLAKMTNSELHTVMVGGFATIAGGVFALYTIGFGINAGHLMVASVMAVPAGLICSKMLWPESGTPETLGLSDVRMERPASNVVEAAAIGTTDGLRLALNVGAMLVAFLGLMAVANWALGGVGAGVDWVAQEVTSGVVFGADKPLSLDMLLGWLFSPIAAVMGVPWSEIPTLAELLGKKLILTELVAYGDLGALEKAGDISPRAAMIASFALCGFANIGSVGIQIGGLGAMAPERRKDIARLAFRAMFAGAIATCMTACLAGVLGGV